MPVSVYDNCLDARVKKIPREKVRRERVNKRKQRREERQGSKLSKKMAAHVVGVFFSQSDKKDFY